ncbi:hypothetical protein [Streptoalloteichus hindustanus]|uniref:Uncharacterized protein n=1 Tax=Streptoalloteichus hindustanus TaxID=2017 RepID=A0A1M5FIF2_STRHI|nr:hypothetical protein [Streptoalloteichus hindustanus]SHF91266.1 hypothetical protein SAMN05444320_105454 [Streptoalloteichus hindustanus]
MVFVSQGYPRVLEDREVLVVRAGDQQRARLRGWLDGYDGPCPLYRIELFLGRDRYTASASNMFASLVRLRRQLEPEGWMIAVQGARRDTFPSGMTLDMGGGMEVYVMRPGHKSSVDDLVETLADAAVEQLGTVDEQRAWRDAWFAEVKNAPR